MFQSIDNNKKGLFIVFEGIDRSGKTTLSKLLYEKLLSECSNPQDRDTIHIIRFPDRTNQTGPLINELLNGNIHLHECTTHLLFSANRWENQDQIRHWLIQGHTVICDRYKDSGIAYSIAKGLDREWCYQADIGLSEPDIVIFLDITADVTAKRNNYGEEIFEKKEFQDKVYDAYKLLIKNNWFLLDGQSDSKTLLQQVVDIIECQKLKK